MHRGLGPKLNRPYTGTVPFEILTVSPRAWPPRLIDALVPHLDPALLSKDYRAEWSPTNPTAGFCSIAAEAAYFLLGGVKQGWVAMVAADPEGGTHWWLERSTSQGRERFDPTAAQYLSQGLTPPYERGRPSGFMGQRQDPGHPYGFDRRPGRRAEAVLTGVMTAHGHTGPLTERAVHQVREQIGLAATGATPADPTPTASRRPRLR